MNNIDIQMKEDMHEMKKRVKAMEDKIEVLTEDIRTQDVVQDDMNGAIDQVVDDLEHAYNDIEKAVLRSISGAIRELQEYLADKDGVPAGMAFEVV